MKDTGVIRKIDELGRIVIPKEIRRTMGIKDGENMQIYLSEDLICLKKYSFFSSIKEFAFMVISLIYEEFGYHALIFNNEGLIVSSTSIVETNFFDNKIFDCYSKVETYESVLKEKIFEMEGFFYGIPLMLSSECIGYLVLYSNNKLDSSVNKLSKFLVKLLVCPYEIG